MDALTLHRLHFAFTITFHYLFPQLTMGLAPLIVILKTMALRTREPATTMRRAFGPGSSPSTSRWSSYWHPDGIPVWHQLGEFSRAPAASSASRWRWRACSPSFWNRVSSGYFCLAKNVCSRGSLGRRFSGVCRLMALRFPDRCDGCMDAAPGRLPRPNGVRCDQLLGRAAESWALDAVCAQYVRRRGNGVVCNIGHWRLYLLKSDEDCGRFFAAWEWSAGYRRVLRFPTGDLHGKHMASYQPPLGRDGRAVQKRSGRAAGAPGAAGRGSSGVSITRSWPTSVLSFLIYGTTAPR